MSIVFLIIAVSLFLVSMHGVIQAIRYDGRCYRCGSQLRIGGYYGEKSWCPNCSGGGVVDAAIGEVIRKREKQ